MTGAFCGLWVSVAAGRLTGAEDAGTGLRKWWAGGRPRGRAEGKGHTGLAGVLSPSLRAWSVAPTFLREVSGEKTGLCLNGRGGLRGSGPWRETLGLPPSAGPALSPASSPRSGLLPGYVAAVLRNLPPPSSGGWDRGPNTPVPSPPTLVLGPLCPQASPEAVLAGGEAHLGATNLCLNPGPDT